MIENLIELLVVIVVFLDIKYITFKVTEEDKIPNFLNYEPYVCYRCLSFWTLTALFLVSGLILNLWITMAVGLILTALDTIALSVHIKHNTVKIDLNDELDK